jgi:CBS domain-containing protein
MEPMASRREPGAGQALLRWYRRHSRAPSRLWLWRAGAAASLSLGLIFAALALVSSMSWAFICFLCLAAAIVCLIRSEPDESPVAHVPVRPGSVPQRGPAPEPVPSPEPVAAPRPEPQPRRSGIAVKDVMTPTPTALPTDAPVAAAARAMRDLDVGAVVVMENDKPLGIVTDRDIVVRALARGRGLDAATVGDICSRDLATVPAGASVEDALGVMAARGVRRLPVTIARGSVVGIVSIDDLVDAGGAVPALREIRDHPPTR